MRLKKENWLGGYFSTDERCYENLRQKKKICKKQGDGDPVHRIHVDSYGGFHCKFVLATETLY